MHLNISDAICAMHGFMPSPSPSQPRDFGSVPLDRLPLSMAYVPMQSWGETYDGLRALDAGTIFPDLDLPFAGRRLCK